MFNWIGISIDMNTLGLVPNINLNKDAILGTLNTNMQTKNSVLWMKKKLKSFLMNNVTFYFRETITSKKFAWETLEKLFVVASEKYVHCSRDFMKFHSLKNNNFSKELDLIIARVIYVVIRSFFKYLVCNIREGTVFKKEDYHEFFTFSLKFFEDKFKKYKNEFSGVHKVLQSRQKRMEKEK